MVKNKVDHSEVVMSIRHALGLSDAQINAVLDLYRLYGRRLKATKGD